jgi:hypothetical protein
MRDRLIELLQNVPTDYAGNRGIGTVADHLIENGVIVLPCKVGDSVYLLQKYYGTYCFNVVEDKVQMIGVTSRGIHIKARNHHDHNKMYMLGKTVFLTKEEAEQVLKGGADNGSNT